MKKITLLLATVVASFTMNAQVVISQSVDPVTVDDSGVACHSTQPSYGDNNFYRAYDLPNDFGITNDFTVNSIQIGQGSAGDGIVMTATLYITDAFPGGTMVPIHTQDYTLSSADDMSLIKRPFVTTIPANSLAVLEISFPEAPAGGTVLKFFPGTNGAGQNDPSYIKSNTCSISTPTDVSTVVAGNTDAYVMNLSDEVVAASSNNVVLSEVSVYPNPVNDVLNINVPASLEIESATLVNILGQSTPVNISNNTINTANLNSGVYLLNIITNEGTITKKIVKN